MRAAWLLIEVPYLKRFRICGKQDWDKHSGRLWDFANALEPIGLFLAYLGVGLLPNLLYSIRFAGLLILVTGVAIRWTAIIQLGRFFNSTVTIHPDHRIVQTGLYSLIRHPAYAGALVAHAGLGLAFGSWVSMLMSTVPFLIAAVYRMNVEEEALRRSLGQEYLTYQDRTYRLVPKVY